MVEDKDTDELKIIDKRRFDSEGQAKDGEVAKESVNPVLDSEMKKPSGEFTVKDSAEEEKDLRKIDFSSFVMSLATQVLMQLGEIESPEGMNIEKNTEIASQTIDVLSMLQEKTKGNLSAEESKLITEILYNLKISYVKVAG